MWIRFVQEAEVAVHPDKPDKRSAFAPGDEAELLDGVAERLIRSGAATRAERPAAEAPAPAPSSRGSRKYRPGK